MSKSNVIVLTPSTVKRTITPRRPPNAELRTREHLTDTEVEALIEVVKENRDGHRDALMILLAYRHGLRAAEVVDLRWEQIDFKSATLHVRRLKNGTPATHPLTGRELRALRRHQREGRAVRVRVHVESGSTICGPRLFPHDRAGRYQGRARHQGACSHASARLRVQTGE